LVGIVAGILTVLGFVRFFPLGRNRALAFAPNPGLGVVRLSLLFSAAWFLIVFLHGADANVEGGYILLYVALACACLFWGSYARPILSIYGPADVLERGNLAAALVLAGFTLGTALAFGGALTGDDASCAGERLASAKCQAIAAATPEFPAGSVGEGGWHVVLVFFLLAYVELRASIALVDRLGGGLADQARLDRDLSAGVLLGAVAVAAGSVAGRAAAGDFLGWSEAWSDYWARLWPLALVPLAGAVVGWLTTGRPYRVSMRSAASLALVAAGAAWYVLT